MLLKHIFLLCMAARKYADGWQDTWYDVYYHTNVKFNMIVVEHPCTVVYLRLINALLVFEIQRALWSINIAININMGQVQIFFDIYVVLNMGSFISELWVFMVIQAVENSLFLDL